MSLIIKPKNHFNLLIFNTMKTLCTFGDYTCSANYYADNADFAIACMVVVIIFTAIAIFIAIDPLNK